MMTRKFASKTLVALSAVLELRTERTQVAPRSEKQFLTLFAPSERKNPMTYSHFSRITTLALAIVLFVSVAVPVQAANILLDPSFEDTTVPFFDGTPDFTDVASPWVASPATGTGAPQLVDQFASDGTNSAIFRDNTTSPSQTISQDFTTVAGAEYEFSFDYRGRNSLEMSLRATITNDSLGDILDQSFTFSTTAYTTFVSPTFLGDGGDYTLTIQETSATSVSRDPHLDNFAINEIFPIPEPSSMSLFGLGGLALILRRRRRGR